MHTGRLVAFSFVAAILTVAGVALGRQVGAPLWLSIGVCLLVILALTFVVRRIQVGRWTFGRRHWTGTHDGRSVEVVFDERLVFLNRLTLLVDGRPVDHKTIWYGRKDLEGGGVTARVGSGWIGECTGIVVTDTAGREHALVESA